MGSGASMPFAHCCSHVSDTARASTAASATPATSITARTAARRAITRSTPSRRLACNHVTAFVDVAAVCSHRSTA